MRKYESTNRGIGDTRKGGESMKVNSDEVKIGTRKNYKLEIGEKKEKEEKGIKENIHRTSNQLNIFKPLKKCSRHSENHHKEEKRVMDS